jgi:PAS domain S-box-containing protein
MGSQTVSPVSERAHDRPLVEPRVESRAPRPPRFPVREPRRPSNRVSWAAPLGMVVLVLLVELLRQANVPVVAPFGLLAAGLALAAGLGGSRAALTSAAVVAAYIGFGGVTDTLVSVTGGRTDGFLWPAVSVLAVFVLALLVGRQKDRSDRLLRALSDDVAERSGVEAALRESEERSARIVETIASGIAIIDMDGKITFANETAEGILGLSRTDMTERMHDDPAWRMTTMSGVPMEDEDAPVGRVLRSGSPVHDVELAVEQPNGTRVALSVNAAPIRDPSGAMVAVVASFTDISVRKLAEEAVRRATQEAEGANRAKNEFLSRMSHELRTPLNSILGFGQLLEMGTLDADQAEGVGHIVKAGRHLLNLINEILDIARIEEGRLSLSLEPISMGDVVPEAIDLVAPMAAERDIALSHEGIPPTGRHVMADRQRLMQVLLNLLSNAVKYNRAGGSATVRCGPPADGRVRIEVRDTGPGISGEQLSKLFSPFERLEAGNTEVQGTGLGLALSKRLVEAMGGTVGVESAPGEGATFWVELPEGTRPLDRLADDGEQDTEASAGLPRSSEDVERLRAVLYIEDNLANVELVERILARRPAVRLLVAMEGKLGVDLARDHLPELILLDLHLPDINGAEVLGILKGDRRTERIPVVVVSADATEGQIRRLLDAGAERYVTKPLDVPMLLEVVDDVLARDGALHG